MALGPHKPPHSPWKISCRVAATFSGCLAAVTGVLSAEQARMVTQSSETARARRPQHRYSGSVISTPQCEVRSTGDSMRLSVCRWLPPPGPEAGGLTPSAQHGPFHPGQLRWPCGQGRPSRGRLDPRAAEGHVCLTCPLLCHGCGGQGHRLEVKGLLRRLQSVLLQRPLQTRDGHRQT